MDVVELIAVGFELELHNRVERRACRDNSNRVKYSVPPLAECMLTGKQLKCRKGYGELGQSLITRAVRDEPADPANINPSIISSGCQLKTGQILLSTNLVSRPEPLSRLVHE